MPWHWSKCGQCSRSSGYDLDPVYFQYVWIISIQNFRCHYVFRWTGMHSRWFLHNHLKHPGISFQMSWSWSRARKHLPYDPVAYSVQRASRSRLVGFASLTSKVHRFCQKRFLQCSNLMCPPIKAPLFKRKSPMGHVLVDHLSAKWASVIQTPRQTLKRAPVYAIYMDMEKL